MPKLRALDGVLRGQDFPLPAQQSTQIGRRSECGISVNHPKVSRVHAEIFFDNDGRAFLRDLDAANGTYINGIKCVAETPYPINPGDEIRLGGVSFRYFTDTRLPDVEIPGHELLDIIAEGGMGTIYLARQTAMARDVAVKILNPAYACRREFVERFIQEARSAGRLNHPNIIQVHNVGKTAGEAYYFTMELVRGHNLTQRMGRERLSLAEIVRAGARIADALQYAHEQGIIHRDIKPDNIMIADTGEVKLADLGIAKTEEFGEEKSAHKRVLGTPHYMSPEQACARPIDARSDLYSLGATLYHAVCGHPVFEAVTPAEVMRMHVNQAPRPLADAAPGTPADLCRVIDRLLQKDPDDRYPDAGAVKDALEQCARRLDEDAAFPADPTSHTGLDPAVSPPGEEPRAPAASGSGRLALVAFGVALALGLGGLFWWANRPASEVHDNGDTRESGQDEPRDGPSSGPDGDNSRNRRRRGPAAAIDEAQRLMDAESFEQAGRVLAALRGDEEAALDEGAAWRSDMTRAEERLRAGLARQKRAAELEAARRAYKEKHDANPDDVAALREALAKLRADFPEMSAFVRQEDRRLAEFVQRRDTERKRALDDDLSALRTARRYDDAAARIDRFLRENPEFPDPARVGGLKADIAAEADAAVKEHRERVRGAATPVAVLGAVARFENEVQYAAAAKEFKALAADAEKKLRVEFDAALAECRRWVLALNFAQAEGVWLERRGPWQGTAFGEMVAERLLQTVAARETHEAFVKAVAAAAPWTVPSDYAIKPLAGEEVVGASSRGVSCKRGVGSTTVLWEKLSPAERVMLYERYLVMPAQKEGIAQYKKLMNLKP